MEMQIFLIGLPSANTRENFDASTMIGDDQVTVYWPKDKVHYRGTGKILHRDGSGTELYEDDAKERLNLNGENWQYDAALDSANSSFATTADLEPTE